MFSAVCSQKQKPKYSGQLEGVARSPHMQELRRGWSFCSNLQHVKIKPKQQGGGDYRPRSKIISEQTKQLPQGVQSQGRRSRVHSKVLRNLYANGYFYYRFLDQTFYGQQGLTHTIQSSPFRILYPGRGIGGEEVRQNAQYLIQIDPQMIHLLTN